jgi:acetoacetyl-CoA synthetase
MTTQSIFSGRSHSTMNRGGVRMGTSETYRAGLHEPDLVDAPVVDLPCGDDPSWMPCLVVPGDGVAVTDEMKARIRALARGDIRLPLTS